MACKCTRYVCVCVYHPSNINHTKFDWLIVDRASEWGIGLSRLFANELRRARWIEWKIQANVAANSIKYFDIKWMTTTATKTATTTTDRPIDRKKAAIQAWRMRKYFDFAQSLYLQNLIIIQFVFTCLLSPFLCSLLLPSSSHRRLSMNFCIVKR